MINAFAFQIHFPIFPSCLLNLPRPHFYPIPFGAPAPLGCRIFYEVQMTGGYGLILPYVQGSVYPVLVLFARLAPSLPTGGKIFWLSFFMLWFIIVPFIMIAYHYAGYFRHRHASLCDFLGNDRYENSPLGISFIVFQYYRGIIFRALSWCRPLRYSFLCLTITAYPTVFSFPVSLSFTEATTRSPTPAEATLPFDGLLVYYAKYLLTVPRRSYLGHGRVILKKPRITLLLSAFILVFTYR